MKAYGIGMTVLTALACVRGEAARNPATAVAVTDSARPWRKPGDKIDSILPMPEYLRRFREGLTKPARLAGGSSSRDGLARAFLSAVASRDTSAVSGLLVNRAEFGWLVFPDHRYASPPYELDPAVFWLQLSGETDKGLHRVFERYGGKVLGFRALACQRDTLQIRTGPVKVWSSCRVTFQAGDSVESHRMFGSIVERDGRVKLLSLATDF